MGSARSVGLVRRGGVWLVVVVVALGLLLSCGVAEGTGGAYRKPPFNGSIFGKRSGEGGVIGGGAGGGIGGGNGVGTMTMDGAKGSLGPLGSLCEIALETCSSLYLESR